VKRITSKRTRMAAHMLSNMGEDHSVTKTEPKTGPGTKNREEKEERNEV